ncbi:hypothetical protein ACOME3_007984 [Neoechinorhynchus agilis]
MFMYKVEIERFEINKGRKALMAFIERFTRALLLISRKGFLDVLIRNYISQVYPKGRTIAEAYKINAVANIFKRAIKIASNVHVMRKDIESIFTKLQDKDGIG